MENKTAKERLLLEKHVDFIANYGKTHEKYVNQRPVYIKLLT
jgi:hypothetical protein